MTIATSGVEQRANLAREYRTYTVTPVQLRDAKTGPPHFIGDASMVDTPYTVRDQFGEFTETIATGAFDKTLRDGADVRLLVNHTGVPLARTKSGTLKLAATPHLHVEAPLDPANPTVQEVRSAMARGDLDQMSIGFRAIKDEWNASYTERRVTEAALFDVSIVTDPASPSTQASLRASYGFNVGASSTPPGKDTMGNGGAGGAGPNASSATNLSQTSGTALDTGLGTFAEGPVINQTLGENDLASSALNQMHIKATMGGATASGTGAGVTTAGVSNFGDDTPGLPAPTSNPDIGAAIAHLTAAQADLTALVTAINNHYTGRSRRANQGVEITPIMAGVDPAPLIQRLDMILDQADDVVDALLAVYGLGDADDSNAAGQSGPGAMPGSQYNSSHPVYYDDMRTLLGRKQRVSINA